jgi:hypothetical protein
MNIPFDRDTAFQPGPGQVVHRLHIHPEFGAGAEEASEPQGGVGGDRPLALDDRADARGRDAHRHGQRVDRQAERLQKFLGQNLTRMGGDAVGVATPLMVIDDFDIGGTLLGPGEANAPLIVDPDRMLAPLNSGLKFHPLPAVARRARRAGIASNPPGWRHRRDA